MMIFWVTFCSNNFFTLLPKKQFQNTVCCCYWLQKGFDVDCTFQLSFDVNVLEFFGWEAFLATF
jgi:hypothetical protein